MSAKPSVKHRVWWFVLAFLLAAAAVWAMSHYQTCQANLANCDVSPYSGACAPRFNCRPNAWTYWLLSLPGITVLVALIKKAPTKVDGAGTSP